jgi:hypothetical protein
LKIDIRIKKAAGFHSHMSFLRESATAETRGDCGENAKDQQNKGADAAQQQAASVSPLSVAN